MTRECWKPILEIISNRAALLAELEYNVKVKYSLFVSLQRQVRKNKPSERLLPFVSSTILHMSIDVFAKTPSKFKFTNYL